MRSLSQRLTVFASLIFVATLHASEIALLHVAVLDPATFSSDVSVKVDGVEVVSSLAYGASVDLQLARLGRLTITEIATGTLLFDKNLTTVPEAKGLAVLYGGANNRPFHVQFLGGRICTEPNERCHQVANFAPLPKPEFSFQDQVRYNLRCHSSTDPGSKSIKAAGKSAGARYAKPNSSSHEEFTIDSGRICNLEGIHNEIHDISWPEAHGLDIPAGTNGRFIIIGDGQIEPLQVIALIDGSIADLSDSPIIDPNEFLESKLTWFSVDQIGTGLVLQFVENDHRIVGVEYGHDESGAPRWTFLDLSESDLFSENFAHYTGTQFEVTKPEGELKFVPLGGIKVFIGDELLLTPPTGPAKKFRRSISDTH